MIGINKNVGYDTLLKTLYLYFKVHPHICDQMNKIPLTNSWAQILESNILNVFYMSVYMLEQYPNTFCMFYYKICVHESKSQTALVDFNMKIV